MKGKHARYGISGRIVACLIAIIGALLAAGCATRGAYLEAEEIDGIQQSITTATELEASLGIPSVTVPRDDGTVMWVYEGIHVRADATQYIPYLSLLVGTNSKYCTRLTVLVDRDTGTLSNWDYTVGKDRDFWARTDDKCVKPADDR